MRRVNKEQSGGAGKGGRFLPGVIIIAFMAASVTFFLMIHIEKKLLSDYEKETVWVANANLQKSLEISGKNISECFVQVEMEKAKVPGAVVKDIGSLEGSMTAIMIPEGTVLVTTMFTDEGSYTDSLFQPVIAGCKADDLYQFVSGILRKGDRVNIYTVSDELGEAYLLWENVLVYQTFDSAGNLISPEDTVTAAARINVLLEKGDAEQFYSEMNKGSLRIVKVWDS